MSTEVASAVLLIAVSIAFNLAFFELGRAFDYPNILRKEPDEILTRFHAGPSGLIRRGHGRRAVREGEAGLKRGHRRNPRVRRPKRGARLAARRHDRPDCLLCLVAVARCPGHRPAVFAATAAALAVLSAYVAVS